VFSHKPPGISHLNHQWAPPGDKVDTIIPRIQRDEVTCPRSHGLERLHLNTVLFLLYQTSHITVTVYFKLFHNFLYDDSIK
jgi:hypothetical protein